MKLLLLGRNGQVGWELQRSLAPLGELIALDRQERGNGELSAIQEVEQEFGIPVVSIICLDQVLNYLQSNTGFAEHASRVASYRDRYGV